MHKFIAPLAVTFAAACALPAQALVMIDNFSSGSASALIPADPVGYAGIYREQAGSMASGHRQWYVGMHGPAGLGGIVDISPRGFELRENTGVYHRTDWFYGSTYVGHDHLMLLDLSAEDTLRFAFAEVPQGLNFNVLLYYRHQLDNYSQLGVNIAPSSGPVNVDFSLADFVAHTADPTRPGDMTQVTGIYIVTQSGGAVGTGGEGFVLSTISAVPEPTSALLGACGLLAVLLRTRRRAAASN